MDRCKALYAAVDAAIDREQVRDAMSAAVAGFPYLRTDRLLSSYRDELGDEIARRFWIERLAQLDRDARAIEIDNLSAAGRRELQSAADDGAPGSAPPSTPLLGRLDACTQRLITTDAAEPARREALREASAVPDDYSTAMRAIGFYALTRMPFAAGIRRWQGETDQTFAKPLERLPVVGTVQRFAPMDMAPLSRTEAAALIAAAAANPLRLPLPDGQALRRLALAYAPVYEVDVATDDDRIGAPRLSADGRAQIDVQRPTVFYRAAHTRIGSEALLQLVYFAWFPARPKTGAFDLLGGHLDGVIWRVTLAPDGEPILFDTIHHCGCYHMFFPTPRLEARAAPDTIEEWLFVPQSLPRTGEDERAIVRIAARTHYVERVRFAADRAATDTPYALEHEDALRSLPAGGDAKRSLYGPDGLVAGSERGERFFFWPMGIASPGAMRQWGRHATAFVGRRHFDDARLIDERFRLLGP
jgi:hypothetical protein